MVVFEVADSGVGITREQLGRVWDRFYQGESTSTRRFGGTGLGLSIVKRLTELHGGTVEVSSPGPDRGSTFRVALPAAPAAHSAAPDRDGEPNVGALVNQRPRESGQAGDGGARRPTVLVVEDDPDIATVLETYLDREGYGVAHASDGQEALRLAHAVRPFAITLDIMLPKLDGWSVLNALKRDPELAGIPVVVISIVDNRTFGMVLGATDYLVKPIDPEQFRAVLQHLAGDPRPGQDCLLVVDDDPQIRDVLGTTLAAEGWQVLTAAGGREALDLVAREHPRAMLLDLMMPDVDGFDVLRTLRQDPVTNSLPVVVVTAKELTEDDRRRLAGAAERVIVKQSTPIDKLGEQVRDALAAHAAHGA